VIGIGNGGTLLTQSSTTKVLAFPRVSMAEGISKFPTDASLPATWKGFVSGNVVYNNIAEFQMGIAFTNASNQPSNVTLTAYGPSGNLISGQDIHNPATMLQDVQGKDTPIIPAWYQVAKYIYEIFGTGILKKEGWVRVDCTGGNIVGLDFLYPDDFHYISGAQALDAKNASYRVLLPLLDCRPVDLWQYYSSQLPIGPFYRTYVEVINPSDTVAKVTINQWFKQNGGYLTYPVYAPYLNWIGFVPPNGKVHLNWNYEALTDPGDNFLEVLSEGGKVLAHQVSFLNDDALTVKKTLTLTAVNGMSPAEGTYAQPIDTTPAPGKTYIPLARPHIVNGAGWYTQFLYLHSPRPNGWIGTTFGDYMIFDQNGQAQTWTQCGTTPCWPKVPSHATKTMLNFSDLMPLMSKSAQFSGSISYRNISESTPDAGLLDWVVYGPTNSDNSYSNAFRTIVPPISATTQAVYPHVAEGQFAPGRFFGTGLAIRDIRSGDNLDPTPNHIALELHGSDGTLLQTAGFDLGRGYKISMTLPQLFPNMALPQFGGYVKSSGTKPYVSFGVYWVTSDGQLITASMIPQFPLN
jgi:hypothetical protein